MLIDELQSETCFNQVYEKENIILMINNAMFAFDINAEKSSGAALCEIYLNYLTLVFQ